MEAELITKGGEINVFVDISFVCNATIILTSLAGAKLLAVVEINVGLLYL